MKNLKIYYSMLIVHLIKKQLRHGTHMNRILDIVKLLLSLFMGTFFFAGAIGYLVHPTEPYPNYMYLCCAVCYLISVLLDIYIFFKPQKNVI